FDMKQMVLLNTQTLQRINNCFKFIEMNNQNNVETMNIFWLNYYQPTKFNAVNRDYSNMCFIFRHAKFDIFAQMLGRWPEISEYVKNSPWGGSSGSLFLDACANSDVRMLEYFENCCNDENSHVRGYN